MSFAFLAETPNFTFWFDDDPGWILHTQPRAQILCDTAEGHFDALKSWFGVYTGFGIGPGRKKIAVRVYGDRALNIYGSNQGYDQGFIEVPAFSIAFLGGPQGVHVPAPGKYVEILFVHHLVHVMNDYQNLLGPATYTPRDSNGEALAVFCSIERFSADYYALFGPRIGRWLWSHREEDFISQPLIDASAEHDSIRGDNTERSIACALSFHYYLKSQRGCSVTDIIRNRGKTLEDTFRNTTAETGGHATITNLLDLYFPRQPMPPGALPDDDVFPLLDISHRWVVLEANRSASGSPTLLDSGSVYRSFLGGCGAQEYNFDLLRTPEHVACHARALGFGMTSARWFVNNVQVDFSIGEITVPALVTLQDPRLPGGSETTASMVLIKCTEPTVAHGYANEYWLTLDIPGIDRLVDLTVRVEIADLVFEPTVFTQAVERVVVQNSRVVFEPAYDENLQSCIAEFMDGLRNRPFGRPVDPLLRVLASLREPPSEEFRMGLRHLQEIAQVVAVFDRGTSLDIHRRIVDHLHAHFGVAPKLLEALATDLEQRLRPE